MAKPFFPRLHRNVAIVVATNGRDQRTREGRVLCIQDSVGIGCMLPSTARHLVLIIAVAVHESYPITLENLCRWSSCSGRTVKKYLGILAAACGDDPVPFIRDVVNRQRSVSDWISALENHGGRCA